MSDSSVDPSPRFPALESTVSGQVLYRGDSGYDEARRVWNARFDRRPDVIVRAADTEDVVAAVNTARDAGLTLSVKGGGHSYAGVTVAEGGLLVDLGGMCDVEVDPEKRVARVGGGATWADVDRETTRVGLATPGGTVSSVGVAGFTLGGGAGWLTRRFGMAVDNLLGAEVVTATGEVVRTSETEYPDLFWALRGGGGNFGVVTRFEYRLHDIPETMLAGQVLYPVERAPEILRFYRDMFREAPDALACYPFFIRIPPLPVFPDEIHGDVVLDMVVCWSGDPEEGEEWVRPFREQGGAVMDTVAPTPYTDLQTAFDAGMGYGNRWYTRWLLLDEVGDDFIDALVAGLNPFPGALTAVYLGAMGGAAGRVPSDATAYPHRDAVDALHIFPGWMDESGDDEVMTWARDLYGSLEPFAADGVYVNMLAEDEEGRLGEAHAENHERLVRIKNRWDPRNLFRMNHNIRPSDR